MVLVDTSIWIDHLRKSNAHLEQLLLDLEAACHPFIIGEPACGNLENRTEILTLQQALPLEPTLEHDEILHFIEHNNLTGIGHGLMDVHLLASARLAHLPLRTSDKKVFHPARELHIAYIF